MNATLTASLTCEHANQAEYWHDNDNCEANDCEAVECLDCAEYATNCEQ